MNSRRLTTGATSVLSRSWGHRGTLNRKRRSGLADRTRRLAVLAAVSVFVGSALVASAGTAAAGEPSASITVLTLTNNPSTTDSYVHMHVTVSDPRCSATTACVIPKGTVTFSGFPNSGSQVITLRWSPAVGSTADYDYSNRQGGTYTLTASYSGDFNFTASHDSGTQVVNKVSSTVALSQSSDISFAGQSVTFTALVSVLSSVFGGVSGGDVQFYEGGTPYGGPVPVSCGDAGCAAALTTNTLSGSQGFVARYSGDPYIDGSASNQVTHTIGNPPTAISFSSSVNPSQAGQPVSLTITVVPPPGTPPSPTPTGTVTLYAFGSPINQGSLDANGQITFDVSFDIGIGDTPFTATYFGDVNYPQGNSGTYVQLVSKANTIAALSSSANPAVVGQPITVTVTVTAPRGFTGPPSGTVTLYAYGDPVQQGPVDNTGRISFDITLDVGLGDSSITANYYGDTNNLTSSADTLIQTVNKAATSTALSSSANPAAPGQSVTFTAAVVNTPPGSSGPTGTVTFKDGSTTVGTSTLDSSRLAHVTTTNLAPGIHHVTATYGGDTYSATSTSSTLDQTITGPTVTGVSPNAGRLTGGQAITVTGTSLTGANAVSIGGVAATNIVVVSATILTATAPAHAAGVVDVRVATPGGTSPATTADHYTYDAAPTVTTVTPRAGPRAGGTKVSIHGTNFVAGSTVHFGAVAATVTFVSVTQLTATAPAHAAGVVDVRVTTPGGTSPATTADHYTYS